MRDKRKMCEQMRKSLRPFMIGIRRLLGLKSGDRILFFKKSNCEVVINNAFAQAIQKAQRAFAGIAEEVGVYNEDDVQELVLDDVQELVLFFLTLEFAPDNMMLN